MLINMKNLIFLFIAWTFLVLSSETIFAQSAIGQLEGMTGTTIDRGYSSSGVDYSEIWRARAEAAAERRAENERRAHEESVRVNNQGNAAYNNRNWESAVSLYRRALRYNPSDAVIRQNLQMAKQKLADQKKTEKLGEFFEKKSKENAKKEEEQRQAFEKKKQPMIKIIQTANSTPAKTDQSTVKSPAAQNKSSFGEGTAPAGTQRIGGLTQQEWSDARACQKEIDLINKVWPVPGKDLKRLDSLEMRRDNLWKRAISVSGLSAADREKLRLKLYTDDIYARSPSIPVLSSEQIKEWKLPEGQKTSLKDEDNTTVSSKPDETKNNTVLKTMLSDMASDKATEMIEEAAADYSKNAFGKKVGPMFGDALGVTKIIYSTSSEGAAAGFGESLEFAISKVKAPRAKLALEGGKIYLDYSQNAFDKFKEEINKFNAAMGLKPIDDSK
jgi:hypothetical protein